MTATMTDVFDLAPLDAPALAETDRDRIAPDVAAWLGTLVFADKREYATAYALHLEGDGPAPADPGTAWAAKARASVAKIMRKRTALAAAPSWHTARCEHECHCGRPIGRGDQYLRATTPSWLSGTGYWETIRTCTDCVGSR